MASIFPAVLCALAALILWSLIGFPVTRRILGAPLALPFAPVTGWALHNVLAVPVFLVLPMTAFHIALVYLVCLGLAVVLGRLEGPKAPSIGIVAVPQDRSPARWYDTAVPNGAWLLAMLLALACAVAILPKEVGDAVILSDQIFDHSKIAIIDDIARLGMPPGNPFFAHDGSNGQLAYYYLWHFSAAELSRLFGVSGWNTDTAMTFFSVLTSLAGMMALAVKFSGRPASSYWVVVLASSCSARTLFEWTFGHATFENFMPAPGGLGGWMFQSSWVPQHLISSSCIVLALMLMTRVASLPATLVVIPLALMCAAGFESSTWIGGVVFAVACIPVVPTLLAATDAKQRVAVFFKLLAAGVLTLVLAWPFLSVQLASAGMRQSAAPVVLRLPQILGPENGAPGGLIDALAYWLLLLPVELPGVYLCGIVVAALLLWRVRLKWQPEATLLAVNTVCSLVAAWLMVSTLASNNDLSWRALLMASVGLIIFAAVGVSSWFASRRYLALSLAFGSFAIGLPETMLQIERNFSGDSDPSGKIFASMPSMWQAVREVSRKDERVASNPSSLSALTPWPVNIGWALLANRRSCYAGWELTQVYTAVPHLKLWTIDEEFKHVFAGTGSPADVHQLATTFDCDVAVVTKSDGAWQVDPFRDSADYQLVREHPDAWRIYHRRSQPPSMAGPG
jgi:hypothetical protein